MQNTNGAVMEVQDYEVMLTDILNKQRMALMFLGSKLKEFPSVLQDESVIELFDTLYTSNEMLADNLMLELQTMESIHKEVLEVSELEEMFAR